VFILKRKVDETIKASEMEDQRNSLGSSMIIWIAFEVKQTPISKWDRAVFIQSRFASAFLDRF
jgi:hypothetical protein